jgi:hypothetical protein
MQQKNIVEVAARTEASPTPLGTMNDEQAQALPEGIDIVVSHPDAERVPAGPDLEEPDQARPLR